MRVTAREAGTGSHQPDGARTSHHKRGAAFAPVIVLDAGQRSALAVTRSLGRRGVPVITAEARAPTLAGHSRFARASGVYADPASAPGRFLEDVQHLARSHGATMVVPVTEITTYVLAASTHELSPTIVAAPPFEPFALLSDKYRLFELAARLGVPIPDTRFVDRPGDAADAADSLGFPVVVKPGRSRIPVDGAWLTGAVRCVRDRAALLALVDADPALHSQPFLLQACVHGRAQGVFAAYDHGESIAMFAHRRLREKPPSGGVSVLCESVPLPAHLREIATQLLNAVRWHGVAMIEFIVADDGTPYLIEANPRFWGSLQLAVDAGVDFPWLLYRIMHGDRPTPIQGYRSGRRLRWLLGDLDRLYLQLRDGKLGWSGGLRDVAGFLRPDILRVRHDVARWDDPGPFGFELRQYLRDLVRAARTRNPR